MPDKIFPENAAIEKLIGLSQEYWCVLDKEGAFRTLNEALKKELPESGVDTFKALLKLKDQTGFIEAIKKAFEEETAQEFLSDTNLKGGERKVRWRILAGNQNNLLYCVGSVIKELVDQESNKLVKAFDQLNITLSNEKFSEKELSNIQNVLSDRVDKFKLISQNVSDIVCLHEPKEARYLYVSPSLKDVTGYDPSDFVGKTPYDFFHPDMQRVVGRGP